MRSTNWNCFLLDQLDKRETLYAINFTKICQKSFLYSKWDIIICETSTKMAIFNSNGSIYNFYPNLPPTFPLYIKWAKAPFKYPKPKFASETGDLVSLPKLTQNLLQFQRSKLKISKMSKIKIHILEISFFEPIIVAKTNATLLQSPLSLHIILIFERLMHWGTKFFATLQDWIGGKDDNKNIKVDFLVLH